MYKILPHLLIALLLVFIYNKSGAQGWINKIQDPSVNFYDVQKSFNKYQEQKEKKEKLKKIFSFGQNIEEENENYILYKRWEHYVAPRVYPSGDRAVMQTGNQEFQKILSNHFYKSAMQAGGNWSPLGAFTIPADGGGAGRLNCIRFHPNNQNTIYVGAPSGGLWKTTNGGLTWSTNTDGLPSIGISDIAIDATDPDIMYIATGDIDASDTYSTGILKSVNGGLSWNITGLNWTTNQARDICRVIINPNDPNMLFAGANTGVFKSIDAGITWTKVLAASNIKDIELKPGDPSTIYAVSSTNFYKSTNTGNNFSVVNNGLPVSSTVGRIAIAVTPADPSYVYLLYTNSTDFGFLGLYRSINSGTSFTMQSDSPNLLGYDTDGQDSGGNGWYTLSLAVSPASQNEIVVGGVNIWKSYDGGVNWSLNAHWTGDGGAPYVHADIHDLIYRPDGDTYYAATDGGIYSTSDGGVSWLDQSSGLQIGQMYRLGCAATNASLVLQGWQDNGTNLYSSGNWEAVLGGDGMECFIDWSDPTYMYAEYQNGALSRSLDGGANFSDIVNNISEPGQWITPWQQDPIDPQTIYAGFLNVWKSTDRGDTWAAISAFNSGGLTCLAVAKSNPLYIYASDGTTIYKTTDGGTTWNTLTNPAGSINTLTYIAVSESNPDKIWLTYSGYTADKKVYKSTNGGSSWNNISGNLPNIPVNCVVNQSGTTDGVYVGTDMGVYYTDAGITSWMPYSNGLPNVIVDELEIHYATNKLRAATYGRGLWETAIYNPASNLPFASFSADSLSGCPGLTVQFSDSTLNSPTSWQWSFPGGTPDTSTLQNPVITYNNPGTYNNVRLVVTNTYGTDSVTKNSYIAISPHIQPVISLSNNDSICEGQNTVLTSSTGNSFSWHPTNQTSQSINANTSGTYSVTVTDAMGCVLTSPTLSIYVFPAMPVPTISIQDDTLISSAISGNQWYLNGTIIPGATAQTYPTQGIFGSYTVVVTDSIGLCSATSAPYVGIEEFNNGISYILYPNPSNGPATLVLQSNQLSDLSIEITDALGKKIYFKNIPSFKGSMETSIDLTTWPKGIYTLTIKNSKGNASKKIVRY